jgi:hypothetical protein
MNALRDRFRRAVRQALTLAHFRAPPAPSLREPIHNDVIHVAPTRALTRERREMRRWRATALVASLLLVVSVMWLAATANDAGFQPTAAASVGAAVKAADQPTNASQYHSEQAKAEIALLRKALQAADKVAGHHRHHSGVMWDLLAGRLSAREAWWKGGDSTCAGWVAAGEYEVAVGKLKGKEVTPPPVPAEGLKFCKQARDRK